MQLPELCGQARAQRKLEILAPETTLLVDTDSGFNGKLTSYIHEYVYTAYSAHIIFQKDEIENSRVYVYRYDENLCVVLVLYFLN